MMKIALLSNVNMNPVNRLLKGAEGLEIYEAPGYGNELGILLNPADALYGFAPDMVFLVMDVMEAIGHTLDAGAAEEKISEWFALFEGALQGHMVYYLSDAYLYGAEMGAAADKHIKRKIENLWSQRLEALTARHSNVRLFEYGAVMERLGEDAAFSKKMWYMGKILHSAEAHRKLADCILRKTEMETSISRKALLLDLDNTLWRGLAGEHCREPIVLSDDKAGLAYKNLQRVILQMKQQGVILGIVSKNNEEDAMEIIRNHPHMVLRESDFAIMKINWESKRDNIVQIAEALNLGLDAFVFFDDNPAERALVRELLPEVAVPEFPDRPEDLPDVMTDIYHHFFERPVVTEEDRQKTQQYRANCLRQNLCAQSADFDSYLERLDMALIRCNPQRHINRLTQLVSKTNQFNLTARRFSEQEIRALLSDESKEVFLYQVTDRFGDNGIVAAAVADYGEEAAVTEFVLSCRVMGRQIENAIVEDLENAARARGYSALAGLYKPTEKNKPAADLYPSLGYEAAGKEAGSVFYRIRLDDIPDRRYRLRRLWEENGAL